MNPADMMVRFVGWWYCGYNNAFNADPTRYNSVGLGGTISQSLRDFVINGHPITESGDRFASGTVGVRAMYFSGVWNVLCKPVRVNWGVFYSISTRQRIDYAINGCAHCLP